MSKYPSTITPEILKQQAHISTSTVQQDIDDTESEIVQLIKEAEGYEARERRLQGQPLARMASFKASNARDNIRRRRDFVAFLRKLLVAKREAEEACPQCGGMLNIIEGPAEECQDCGYYNVP